MSPRYEPGQAVNARPGILIVGGGTAGWLTAAILARKLTSARITLVESRDIATIGVGEGTFPTIAKTLSSLGIDEADFMRQSSAAFKQGIKFVDWASAPEGGRHSHYWHPFALPREPQVMDKALDLLPSWLAGDAGDSPFAESVTLQTAVCDAGLAPKRFTDTDFRAPLNYAYHLDAARFGACLAGVARSLGVTHLEGTVERAELDDHGAIAGVITREHGTLHADLYIDCTGFRSELLGRALGVPFQSCNDVLFVDRAVTVQVPYENANTPIPPYTISTAHEAGWTWDIALAARRGIGYVYSSRHTDDTRAEEVLRSYAPEARDLGVRKLAMQVGWRARHWEKNCVAVGLAGGFLEPLESTGILLIEAAALTLAANFRAGADPDLIAQQFNTGMTSRYERIVDFIKLHYCLTRRTDSAFWRDNADAASNTPSLLAHLDAWRHRPPTEADFDREHESFAVANYRYVLYGMGFKGLTGPAARSSNAREEFARVRVAATRAVASLPPHRELLERVYQAGFSFADNGRIPGAVRS